MWLDLEAAHLECRESQSRVSEEMRKGHYRLQGVKPPGFLPPQVTWGLHNGSTVQKRMRCQTPVLRKYGSLSPALLLLCPLPSPATLAFDLLQIKRVGACRWYILLDMSNFYQKVCLVTDVSLPLTPIPYHPWSRGFIFSSRVAGLKSLPLI